MKMPVDQDAIARLKFNADGLIPVIAQDATTGSVLMLAWANQDALTKSLESGQMTYWSRSRQALWTKGETSGHTQQLTGLYADCDQDALLAMVEQIGPACHEGTGSCWTDSPDAQAPGILGVLDQLAENRLESPTGGYTDSLLGNPAFAAEKVEEEAKEVGAVLRGEDNDDPLEHEAADLFYHLVIALRAGGSNLVKVFQELRGRNK